MNKLCMAIAFVAVFANSALGRIAIFHIPMPFSDQFPNQKQNPQQVQNLGVNLLDRPTQATSTSGTRDPETPTTQSPEVSTCIRNCPVTSEYNPVCGSNNVTYDNLGRLSCAQGCGVDVTMLWKSRCIVPDQF